jgi:hypothetical protein
MEFFLPGLAALLLAALIVFLVLPRLGAPVLAVLSIVLLVYGVWSHMSLFSSEYRYSTWQEQLKFYAPFVMIGGLILAVLFYMGFLFGTEGPSALPASNLPTNNATVNAVVNNVNKAVNAVNNHVNNAVNAVSNTVNSAADAVGSTIDSAANAVGLGNTNRNRIGRNNGILNNLSNILKTPTQANRNNNNRRLSV